MDVQAYKALAGRFDGKEFYFDNARKHGRVRCHFTNRKVWESGRTPDHNPWACWAYVEWVSTEHLNKHGEPAKVNALLCGPHYIEKMIQEGKLIQI
jgi:hypothetical protein